MNGVETILEGLRQQLPVRLVRYRLPKDAGLVIVDEVNGFCTVGAGNLAPPAPDEQIARMVERTDALARAFRAKKRPVLAFLDTHEPDRPEPPYPPHCIRGTGEENLVPQLAWLESDPDVVLVRKDCINGFVGAIEPATARGQHGLSHNKLLDWINLHRLETVVVVGICTDICVMDLVLTLLSARNHGLAPTLRDIVVYEPACATYDLPRETAEKLGLPPTSAHPKWPAHHMGLYFMASRGAILASELEEV
ncbi:MAG: isochorismatase family protein [Geminicoccaceae bacterium]|nr:isochorismatase family protein [Geminicoccaceae bacterium]MCS7266603.1 isochorismatase family protein [Geminicoccaceae bacterium]MCX7630944.1 isochorismatase family protein [Geminicoccaceae bacterium]MDW8123236.1 isochorismatase family protein [Geminicoccaceae bacterium]MDW8340104.1 isochorismatase family protein [Geminicoccaceae bacterium]